MCYFSKPLTLGPRELLAIRSSRSVWASFWLTVARPPVTSHLKFSHRSIPHWPSTVERSPTEWRELFILGGSCRSPNIICLPSSHAFHPKLCVRPLWSILTLIHAILWIPISFSVVNLQPPNLVLIVLSLRSDGLIPIIVFGCAYRKIVEKCANK